MPSKRPQKAIILAAGAGTRMWPYGVTRNKAAIPVANRPLIQWQLEALAAGGIKEVVVVTGYRAEQVRNAIGEPKGISVREVTQSQPAGTASSLHQALDATEPGPFLVVYGDVLFTSGDLQRLLQQADGAQAEWTTLMLPLIDESPSDWICGLVKDDQVRRVLGHPRDDVTHRFAGLFVLDEAVRPYLSRNPGIMTNVQVGMMPPSESALEESLQMAIEDGRTLQAAAPEGPVVDMDKPWHVLQAPALWLPHLAEAMTSNSIASGAKVSDGADIEGHISVGENSVIGRGVIIRGNVWVGKNCRIVDGAILDGNIAVGDGTVIRRYCQVEGNTAVGRECFIGHGAEFEGVMFDRVYSYHYGEYWGVLGSAADLGAATVCGNLRFDDGETAHRVKGRREVPRFGANAAYLGDYVRTGVNCIIMPGVKVGPYSVLGSGAIISEDVPDNTLVYVEQQQVKKKWGPERYGW